MELEQGCKINFRTDVGMYLVESIKIIDEKKFHWFLLKWG